MADSPQILKEIAIKVEGTCTHVNEERAGDTELQVNCLDVLRLEELNNQIQVRYPEVDIKERVKQALSSSIGDEDFRLGSILKNDSHNKYPNNPSHPLMKTEKKLSIKTEEIDIVCDEFQTTSPNNSFCGSDEDQCQESDSLKRQMKDNTRGKLYSCDTCTKCFSQSGHLKMHMLTHTGENPYSCEICKKRFSLSGNLKRHIITHTRDKPYSCDTCTKNYSQHGHLKTHMITHTGEKPFSCDVCKKSFSHSGNLKLHMVTHTGDKPYSCVNCKKRFSRSEDLKRHMITHTGEKPYFCEICEKHFSQSGNLKKHMATHTRDKPKSDDFVFL